MLFCVPNTDPEAVGVPKPAVVEPNTSVFVCPKPLAAVVVVTAPNIPVVVAGAPKTLAV